MTLRRALRWSEVPLPSSVSCSDRHTGARLTVTAHVAFVPAWTASGPSLPHTHCPVSWPSKGVWPSVPTVAMFLPIVPLPPHTQFPQSSGLDAGGADEAYGIAYQRTIIRLASPPVPLPVRFRAERFRTPQQRSVCTLQRKSWKGIGSGELSLEFWISDPSIMEKKSFIVLHCVQICPLVKLTSQFIFITKWSVCGLGLPPTLLGELIGLPQTRCLVGKGLAAENFFSHSGCILETYWKRVNVSFGKAWNLVLASPGNSWKTVL